MATCWPSTTILTGEVDITTVDFGGMTVAVERALWEKQDVSVHQRVGDRLEELEVTRDDVYSEATDSDARGSDIRPARVPGSYQRRADR